MKKLKHRSVFRESYDDELTVGRLRKILEDALDQLDGWNDDDIVNTVGNTYHLGGASTYMCVDRIGFINLRDIDIEEAWDDDEDEDYDEDYDESVKRINRRKPVRNENIKRRS